MRLPDNNCPVLDLSAIRRRRPPPPPGEPVWKILAMIAFAASLLYGLGRPLIACAVIIADWLFKILPAAG